MKLLCCLVAAAVPHYLEAWNDLSLVKGTYSLTQPTIRPLFNTKQFQDVLMSLNRLQVLFYDYIKILVLQLFQVHLGIKYYMMVFFCFYCTNCRGTGSAIILLQIL
jgi:hypothetical protein